MGRADGRWGATQAPGQGRWPGRQAWPHSSCCLPRTRGQRQNCPLPCGSVQTPAPRPEKQASYGSLRRTHGGQSPTGLPVTGRPRTPAVRGLARGLSALPAQPALGSPVYTRPTTGSANQALGGAPEPREAGASHGGGGLLPEPGPRSAGILLSFQGLCMEGAETPTPEYSSRGLFTRGGAGSCFSSWLPHPGNENRSKAGGSLPPVLRLTPVPRRGGPGEPQGAQRRPTTPHSRATFPSQDTIPQRER